MPMAINSFNNGFHDGSVVSIAELRVLDAFECVFCEGDVTLGGMIECGCWWFPEDECLCPPNSPPSIPWCPCDFPLAAFDAPGACIDAPNGLFRVFRCAFFSRSSIFFLNVFASFSSTKLSPARQCSSSKVWKKTRSWLYEKVS